MASSGTLWIFDGGQRYTMPIHVSPQVQRMLEAPAGTPQHHAAWHGLLDIVRRRIAEKRASMA